MRRASISIDFVLSIIALLVVVSALLSFALAEVESAQVNMARLRTEAIAMGIGSAVNRFAAIQPGPGSVLSLDLKLESKDNTPTVLLRPSNCNVSFSGGYVEVWLEFATLQSGEDKLVSAKYPTVKTTPTSGLSCDAKITVHAQEGELSVYA